MKSDNLLFHYTDILAAISILQSGMLYFSHHQKMNDPTEFFYADELLLGAAEQTFDEILKSNDSRLTTSLKGREYQQIRKHDSKWLIGALSGALKNDYYIFSSTQHTDKYEMRNGSLVMWRGYGKENGCAIVFDKEKLVALADALPRNGNAVSTIDGEVCYLKEAEEVKTKFSTEYRVFVDYLKYMATLALNPEGKPLFNRALESYSLPIPHLQYLQQA